MDYLTFEKLPADIQNHATYDDIGSGQILFKSDLSLNYEKYQLAGLSYTSSLLMNRTLLLIDEK